MEVVRIATGPERRPDLLPDTHAHIDAPEFDADRDEVMKRAEDAGVDRILAVGTDLFSSIEAVRLSQRYPAVFAAVGVHPHNAERFDAEAKDVCALLGEGKVVAVGEVGLDFHRGRE